MTKKKKATKGAKSLKVKLPKEIAGVKLKRKYDLDAPKGVRGRNIARTDRRGRLAGDAFRLNQRQQVRHESPK